MKRLLSLPLILALVSCAPSQVAPTPSGATSPQPSTEPSAVVPSTVPSPAGFTVSGNVFDEALSPQVATITAVSDVAAPVTVQSGSDGRFSMRLPAGAYRVKATKEGWVTREQAVTVDRDTTVNFGGLDATTANPYFISNWPEIENVGVTEAAPGGPLTVKLRLSEPVTAESRERFVTRLELKAGTTTEFLRAAGAAETYLRATTAWDAAGQTLTMTYPEPYLASGGSPVRYTVKLRQDMLTEREPGTNDFKWDPIGVADSEGKTLGMNRADYAFLVPSLSPIPLTQLSNDAFGKDHSFRRWNITHTSSHSFIAAADTQGPGLVSAAVRTDRLVGTQNYDILELRFDEPMRVVKDATETQYTRLDKTKQLVVVSTSNFASGASATALDSSVKVQDVRFSRDDANLVTLLFIAGTFKDKKWFEVSLGLDALDPAGNAPNPAKVRASGAVN